MKMRKHLFSHLKEKLSTVAGIYIAVHHPYNKTDDQKTNYERQYRNKEFSVIFNKYRVYHYFGKKRLNHTERGADYTQNQGNYENFFVLSYISV